MNIRQDIVLIAVCFIVVFVSNLHASNLILNGDFSAGNTGFSTGYSLGLSHTSGTYGIFTAGVNTGFFGIVPNDHTTDDGEMFLANGANSNTLIWGQDVAVQQDTVYNFSMWAMTLAMGNGGNNSDLEVMINGLPIGPILGTPFQNRSPWINFTAIWDSGSSTIAQIRIFESSLESSGNDFGLDDISLSAILLTHITSSNSAQAMPIGGSLSEQIEKVNFGPPAYNSDEWEVAHSFSYDNHMASSFECSDPDVSDPLNEPHVSANEFIDDAFEVTYDNCSSAFYKFTFNIQNCSEVLGAELKVNVDDMAVAYLNGHRISPKISAEDFTSEAGRERTENGVPILAWPNMDTLNVNPDLFVQGANVLVFGVIGDAINEYGNQLEPTGVEFAMAIDIKNPPCKGDLDEDGDVDGNDLLEFTNVFGKECTTTSE